MNYKIAFWTYLLNAILLIDHEIDSAYWQEWKLFKIPEEIGPTSFLLIHIPMLFLILYGIVLLYEKSMGGIVISMIMSLSGIFAFVFHFYHLRKGNPGFDTPISKALLVATLGVSMFQMLVNIQLLMS